MNIFSQEELDNFHRDGFILVPGLGQAADLAAMNALSDGYLAGEMEPLEYESLLGYPGAPDSMDSQGGRTIRRLLGAHKRHPVFRNWSRSPGLLGRLRQLLGQEITLTLAHHNCIMIKDTVYSSDTGWHQDIRYWRFEKPELISVMLALNPATEENGCLRFIPGSHLLSFEPEQFVGEEFFSDELPQNRDLIKNERIVPMQTGDVVFFHCRTLHAATRNRGNSPRKSLIFTYYNGSNRPLPDTRSASVDGVEL